MSAPASRAEVLWFDGLAARLRADLRGLYIIWYRDLLRFWRDRARVLAGLGQPVLFLAVFGIGLSSALGAGGGALAGQSFLRFFYPGVLAMALVFTAVFSAMSIVWDREFGFLKEILVAPVGRGAVAVGKALGGSTVAVIQATLLLIPAPLLGVTITPLLVLELLPLMFLLAFALSALGIAVASRMRTMEGFQMVMNFFLMPLFFLSGAFFPLQGIPAWLGVVARLDPVTYGVDPIRRAVLLAGGASPAEVAAVSLDLFGRPLGTLEEVLILGVFALAVLALAVRWFSATE